MNHCTVSLIVVAKVTRLCPSAAAFVEKGECKWPWVYQWPKPTHSHSVQEEGECCSCNICRSGELLVIHHSGSLHSYYIDRDAGFQPRHHFFFTEEYPLGVAAAAYNAKHKVCIFVCITVCLMSYCQHACLCVCVYVCVNVFV